MEDFDLKAEFLASLALLGRLSDKDENGRQEYIKGDDCLASLKDIQHFLHADDVAGDVFQPAMIIEEPGKDQGKAKARRAPWELHRSLVEWNVLQKHLFPLLVDHGEDPEILYETLLLLFLASQLPKTPTIQLDDDKATKQEKWKIYGAGAVPFFENLANIKEQFASSEKVLSIIMRWMIEPLESGKDRTEEEIIVLDLVIQLIKNLLQMDPHPDSGIVLPASLRAKLLAGQDALLIKFSQSHVMEMLMLLAQNVEEDENRNWNLLLLEIFNLIFVKEDPNDLMKAYKVESGEWKESERRKELESKLTRVTVAERKQQHKMRHQRFTGVFSTMSKNGLRFINTSAEGDQKLPERASRGGVRRKAKVEEAVRPQGAGRNEVLLHLNEMAKSFIEVGFNSLIGTVVYDYEMESAALNKADDHNFINVTSWFMKYHRLSEKRRIAALPAKPKPAPVPKPAEGTEGAKQAGAADEQQQQQQQQPRLEDGDKTPPPEDPVEEMRRIAEARRQRDEQEALEEAQEKQREEAQEAQGASGMDEGGAKANEERQEMIPAEEEGPSGGLVSNETETETERASLIAASSAWAALPSVVSWNLTPRAGAKAPNGGASSVALATPSDDAVMGDRDKTPGPEEVMDKEKEGEHDDKAKTPEPEYEPPSPYDYNASYVSSIIDVKNLKWAMDRALKFAKPEKGTGIKAQYEQLPETVEMMREMILVLTQLYNSETKRSKDAGATLIRKMIYEWDYAEVVIVLLKEYRPFRNTARYLGTLAEVVHTLLRLVKTFSEQNEGVQRLKKRRKKIGRRQGEREGDGEWLGGEDDDEDEEEEWEETAFNFQTYLNRFAHFQVVSTYAYLLSHYRTNSETTNHQAVKMMDTIARKCGMLPILYQLTTFKVFDQILCDRSIEKKKEYKEMVDFVRWVVREYFKLALQSPCLFVEPITWTKSHKDAELIQRGYGPEEAKPARRGRKDLDEELLYQAGQAGKWNKDDDLALTEAFTQFSSRPNAPQIIASLFDGRTPKQIALRLNKLGLFMSHGGDWSEDEDEDEANDVFTCSRRLRNTKPESLDFLISCMEAACVARNDIISDRNADEHNLPECFHEVQDFAIVPVSEAEWDHVIDRGMLRLMGALYFVAPRPLEGKSFWRIPAEILKNPVTFGERLAELKSAAAAPVEVHRTPTPDKGDERNEMERSEEPTRPRERRRRRRASSSDEEDEDEGEREANVRRYVFNNRDSDDDEEEAAPANNLRVDEMEEEEQPQQVSRKRARRLLDEDDEEEEEEERGNEEKNPEGGDGGEQQALGKRAGSEEAQEGSQRVVRRARIALDSDSE